MHPYLYFISYVYLISSLNATLSHIHFTEGPLVFSTEWGQEPPGLHLLPLFKLCINQISYPLLRVFTYMTDLIHSPVPFFFLYHLYGIVLNTSLPLGVILSAVVEIHCILCWFDLPFLSKPDTKTSVWTGCVFSFSFPGADFSFKSAHDKAAYFGGSPGGDRLLHRCQRVHSLPLKNKAA